MRKPYYGVTSSADDKPHPPAKKWTPFSTNDSKSLETAFHNLADEEEHEEFGLHHSDDVIGDVSIAQEPSASKHQSNRSIPHIGSSEIPSPKVPVNEDYLFDVDIRRRELGPAYWIGPIYAVRRGTWFYVDGTNLKPCEENLAFQLEEGFVKTKPWLHAAAQRAALEAKKGKTDPDAKKGDKSADSEAGKDQDKSVQPTATLPTHRMFGSHMNSVAAYQDETTAWLLSDDFMSRMSGSVYQRFAGGAHRSGTKIVRGFQDLSKKKETKDGKRPVTPSSGDGGSVAPGSRSASEERPQSRNEEVDAGTSPAARGEEPESRVRFLERQMSNMVSSAFQDDPRKQEEEARKREEQEIRDDYRDVEGEDQDRQVDHLVLVTHGIGQRLGARFETFNFIHDVNDFRKTLKSVYNDSEDLQALNREVDKLPKNCRIQVLPICWRHMLDFPRQSLKHNRQEHDLGDVGAEEEANYPNIEDITLEGVPALRNIVADLVLDVLLYQTPAYNLHISKIVSQECNRIYDLFKQRNPKFNGKVSLVGHSLGSAVYFDLLAEQVGESPASSRDHVAKKLEQCKLDFDVDNLICFGSPIGLFQMLNGKTLAGRSNPHSVTLDGSHETIEDPFSESHYTSSISRRDPASEAPSMEAIASAPRCNQMYNIFHPTDPIAYRLEPLISSSMNALKPQALPYTKKSFLLAPMGQGITGIPAMVGQTMSGFWSNLSSGLANNFINRSIGLSPADAAKLGAPAPVPHNRSMSAALGDQSLGAGTNITGGGVISAEQVQQQEIAASSIADDERKRKLAQDAAEAERDGTRPPTLIDSEIETLYSGFRKRQKTKDRSSSNDLSRSGDGADPASWMDGGAQARKMKREEAKVRLLNKNGRVDYSIQE